MKNQTTEQIEAGTLEYTDQSSNISFYASLLSFSGIILFFISLFIDCSIDYFFKLYLSGAILTIFFGLTSIHYGNKMRANKEAYTKSELRKGNVSALLSLVTLYFFVPLLSLFSLASISISALRTH